MPASFPGRKGAGCFTWRAGRTFSTCSPGPIESANTSRETKSTSAASSMSRRADARRTAASALDPPPYGLINAQPVLAAAAEAKSNGVTALGLVAAWRGLEEGPVLDEICARLEGLKESGQARRDVSLGIIKSQPVADRLKQAGLECYNHNLESSQRA